MNQFLFKAQVFYTDGTDSGAYSPMPVTSTLNVGQIVTYPSGFQQLGLDALNPTKTPDYYELWLNNGNGVRVTQKMRYYLRDKEFNEVDLWFQSSLGRIEAVALRSGLTRGISVDKNEFQRYLPENLDNTIHELAADDASVVDEYMVSTGYMSLDELLPYIDLLMSKRVWMIKNGQRVPVTVPKGQYSIVQEAASEGVYEFALNIKFVKAFTSQSFSAAQ